MKLSLIITVYNCEQYLERCFESIKKQSYDIYEVIVIDDGSKDKSAQMCDEFANTIDNVKVIHKINGGTVAARKSGLEISTGDVVCFIDGDDWIDKDYCKKLIRPFLENEELDVVSSGLLFEYISNPKADYVLLDGAEAGLYRNEEVEKYILPGCIYDYEKDISNISTSICCKMLRRDIALNAMSYMDERLTIGEDGAYVLSVLLNSKNIFVIREAFYHYEQHPGFQNDKVGIETYEQLRHLKNCMVMIAERFNKSAILKEQIEYYVCSYLGKIEKNYFAIDKERRIFLFPEEYMQANSKVIVHGAGNVGRQYVKYIRKTKKYNLVGWTDKNSSSEFRGNGIPCSISELYKMEYDYIVLASNNSYILEDMKSDILQQGVLEEKIISKKPVSYKI